MSEQIQARFLPVPQEADLARRAVRGDAVYEELGYKDLTASSTPQAAPNPFQHAVINVSAAGTWPVIPGVSGQTIEVLEIMLYTDTSMNLELFEGNRSLTGLLKSWPAAQGFFFPHTGEPHFRLTAGAAFNLFTSAVGQISGFIRYRQV